MLSRVVSGLREIVIDPVKIRVFVVTNDLLSSKSFIIINVNQCDNVTRIVYICLPVLIKNPK